MIAHVPSTLRYTLLAAIAIAGAWKLSTSWPANDAPSTVAPPMSVGCATPRIDMTDTVRRFYATRDADIADRVQAWLTQPHENKVDLGMYDEVIQLSRHVQLSACLAIDDHDGDITLAVRIDDGARTMQAIGSNPDVVECVQTIVSSLDITGEGQRVVTMRYWHGRVLDVDAL